MKLYLKSDKGIRFCSFSPLYTARFHTCSASIRPLSVPHSPLFSISLRAVFQRQVWEGALPGRAKRNSVRRRAGCLTLLGPSAYASDLRRFADVVHEVSAHVKLERN